jgi:hypothetical protein
MLNMIVRIDSNKNGGVTVRQTDAFIIPLTAYFGPDRDHRQVIREKCTDDVIHTLVKLQC